MLRQIMTLGLNPGATQQQRTDFAEAGGSFRIKDGILRNDDLRLRAPVLRLEGAGTVDLPQRTVDYRVTPQLATTLQGQGARGEPVLQAGVPFLVQGPFASPSVRFDLNGTLTSAVSSPADLARVAADLAQNPKAVQVLRDQFDLLGQLPVPAAGKARDLIQGVLGGGSKRAPPKGPPDLGNAAKELLKGFGP
jgi:AsmA protein